MASFSCYSSLARQDLLFHELDSIGATRKTASKNFCKRMSATNDRIKSYGPLQLLFQFGVTRPPLQRVWIP